MKEKDILPVIVSQTVMAVLNDTVAKDPDLVKICEEATTTKVGRNTLWKLQLPVALGEQFLDLLVDISLSDDYTRFEREACQSTLSRVAVGLERQKSFIKVEEAPKKTKKAPGGHKTPSWKTLSGDELEQFLLEHVCISDAAWTVKGEKRQPGETREHFVKRVFLERKLLDD